MTPAQIAARNALSTLTVNNRAKTSANKTLTFEDIKNILVSFKTELENFDKAFNIPANSGCFDVLDQLINKKEAMKGQNKIRLASLSRILKSSIVDANLSQVFKQDDKQLQEAKAIYLESASFMLDLITRFTAEPKQDLNNVTSDIATITKTSTIFSAPIPRRATSTSVTPQPAAYETAYQPLRPMTIPVN